MPVPPLPSGRRHCTPSTSQSHRQELRMCGCGQLKSQQPSCRRQAGRLGGRMPIGSGPIAEMADNYFPNRRWSRHRESHMNVSPPLRSQRRFFQSPNCRSGWVNSEGWWFRRRSGPIRWHCRQPSRHRYRACVCLPDVIDTSAGTEAGRLGGRMPIGGGRRRPDIVPPTGDGAVIEYRACV